MLCKGKVVNGLRRGCVERGCAPRTAAHDPPTALSHHPHTCNACPIDHKSTHKGTITKSGEATQATHEEDALRAKQCRIREKRSTATSECNLYCGTSPEWMTKGGKGGTTLHKKKFSSIACFVNSAYIILFETV